MLVGSMGSANSETDAAKKQSRVVQWLNASVPGLNMRLDSNEEELRAQLIDGSVLCAILSQNNPVPSQHGAFIASEQRLDNLQRFLSAMEEMGLPRFNASELERGSMSAVVECLLSLKDQTGTCTREDGVYDFTSSVGQQRKKWNLAEGDRVEPLDVSRGNQILNGTNSPVASDERRKSFSDSKFLRVIRSSVTPGTLRDDIYQRFLKSADVENA